MTIQIIINIGLERPVYTPEWKPAGCPRAQYLHSLKVLRDHLPYNVRIAAAKFANVAPEATAVIHLEARDTGVIGGGYDLSRLESELLHVACKLQQDCIAVYYPLAREGKLVGPFASEWGAFSIRHFIGG